MVLGGYNLRIMCIFICLQSFYLFADASDNYRKIASEVGEVLISESNIIDDPNE